MMNILTGYPANWVGNFLWYNCSFDARRMNCNLFRNKQNIILSSAVHFIFGVSLKMSYYVHSNNIYL